ncbi:leucine-rich melanocyte differentiation-associated protein [Nilaparvata lugens]|uniref:leucine-rich melanocyte differentiation-associated protein n=1 Tax=Nilaparvata lugens TaxID=108931 RepID=UPI00193D4DF7|nr:leucine-rich melanocyte differentiation-associated protein [Nilaparvata lugens]
MTTYERLSTSFDSIDERENMTDEDQRLNLCYENLSTMPKSLVEHFASFVRILDISCNQFSDVSFLTDFQNLRSLILDHNKIDGTTIFPPVPSLNLLWLNHNQVGVLFPFVKNLQKSFPGLQLLSLMGNPGVPADIDDTTFYQHLQYRLFTVSFFAKLKHLDSREVTSHEREEALRLYRRPFLERLVGNSSQVLNSAYSSFNQLFGRSNSQSQVTNRQRSAFI